MRQRLLAQLLGSAQRVIRVKYDASTSRLSTRKPTPCNPKTLGDHLMIGRVKADLTQAEVAAKLKVSDKTLRAWESDQAIPTEAQLTAVLALLPLDAGLRNPKPNGGL
jgi:DNA-binding transcriptional regulator YiaG